MTSHRNPIGATRAQADRQGRLEQVCSVSSAFAQGQEEPQAKIDQEGSRLGTNTVIGDLAGYGHENHKEAAPTRVHIVRCDGGSPRTCDEDQADKGREER